MTVWILTEWWNRPIRQMYRDKALGLDLEIIPKPGEKKIVQVYGSFDLAQFGLLQAMSIRALQQRFALEEHKVIQ